jgi:hypothetical protein
MAIVDLSSQFLGGRHEQINGLVELPLSNDLCAQNIIWVSDEKIHGVKPKLINI